MKREEILRHDGDSVTIEGENKAREYLQHDFEHKKGKGEEPEHREVYGHEDMHNISHNAAPFSQYFDTAFPGARDIWKNRQADNASKIRAGQVKPLSSIPKKPEPAQPM